MYKSSLVGPHGSSKVMQLLLETHCAGSWIKTKEYSEKRRTLFGSLPNSQAKNINYYHHMEERVFLFYFYFFRNYPDHVPIMSHDICEVLAYTMYIISDWLAIPTSI